MFTEEAKGIKNSEEVKSFDPPTSSLILLSTVFFVLLCLVLYLSFYSSFQLYKTPKVVTDFLNGYVASGYNYEEFLVNNLDIYFATPATVTREDGEIYTKDFTAFESVFRLYEVGDGVSYEIVKQLGNYSEIILKDKNNQPIYPRIAFAYTLNPDKTKIVDYTLARLLPFSTRDEEFDPSWQ